MYVGTTIPTPIPVTQWYKLGVHVNEVGIELRARKAEFMQFEFKPNGTRVSKGDMHSQARIIPELRCTLEAVIVAEEAGYALNPIDPTGFTWYLDPIDGTEQFLSDNDPNWSISVGLGFCGIPVGGVIAQPARGERILMPLGSSQIYRCSWYSTEWQEYTRPRHTATLVGLARSSSQEVRDQQARIHARFIDEFGSVEYSAPCVHAVLEIIRGWSIGCLIASRAKCWDLLAVTVALRRLGGVVRHLSGKEVDFMQVDLGSHADPIICAESGAVYERFHRVLAH